MIENKALQSTVVTRGIGWMVRRARDRVGLTQDELARRMGVSSRRWAKIEDGTTEMTVTEWLQFCEFVQILPDSLHLRSLLWSQIEQPRLNTEVEAAMREVPEFYFSSEGREAQVELRKSREILIIEDDFAIQETIRETLNVFGFQSASVFNGQEGLEYLDLNERPKLILLDWMMPVMSGSDFLAEMRQNSPLPTPVPVVVMTANPEKVKDEKGQVSKILSKPFDINLLIDTIETYSSPAVDS